ncbi:MAG TPA: 4Fe-4S binding protein, partial [Chloroflexi bacterium]|nr:4Fe-4S binding protein [Chloroflexota bacterium]
DPYDLDAVEQALRTATEASGPAVIISRRECALLPEARARYAPLQVDEDVCIACGACRRLGCPAMGLSDSIYERTGRPKSRIDPLLCTGCKICAQICPRDGIVPRANEAETL